MPTKLAKTIKAIFTDAAPARQPVLFSWRIIARKGRPFLLLPESGLHLRTGLELYSAQRKRAKFARALMPALFFSPAKIFFDRVMVQADAATEIMQFMAQQSGVPAGRLGTPALKFGGTDQNSRVSLLLGDDTNRPVKVVKIGINPAGRAAINREASLLGKLPPDKLGCIRKTGWLDTVDISAFAADYFPGASPQDDAGLEQLFDSWLNSDAPQPIETLASWHELAAAVAGASPAAWQALQTVLAGKKIRTTLFHGDFAPWNIRAINSRNLQVFDWERGHLHGIPGWDWFHFTIQTSILARRLSVERAASEVEQLLYSDRFKHYAAATGISDVARPLVLAYILHHQWVIKPLEGGATNIKLHEFLAARWQMQPLSAPGPALITAKEKSALPGLWTTARSQLSTAAVHAINLFWEPSLNFQDQPPLSAKMLLHRREILLAAGLLAGLGVLQFYTKVTLTFLPLYVAVCVWLAWKTDRRIGTLMAVIAAMISPLVVALKDASFDSPQIFLWNSTMRFIILEVGVLFAVRIRAQNNLVHPGIDAAPPTGRIAENWAVLLAIILWFAGTAVVDWFTGPLMTCMPLYLFPCMIATLVFNLRGGILATVAAAVTDVFLQSYSDSRFQSPQVIGWNLLMRLALFLLVIVLLDRIRRESILFSARK